MNPSNIVDDKIARVIDILEQIEELNKMIKLQEGENGIASSLKQYRFMREEFVNELTEILGKYQIKLKAA